MGNLFFVSNSKFSTYVVHYQKYSVGDKDQSHKRKDVYFETEATDANFVGIKCNQLETRALDIWGSFEHLYKKKMGLLNCFTAEAAGAVNHIALVVEAESFFFV